MTASYRQKHFIFFLLFLVILFLVTFPLLLKLDTAVYGPMYGTDNRAAIWHFWWFRYSHEHHLSVDVNTLAGFPYGVNGMAPKVFPLPMLPAYFLSIVFNEIIAYNMLLLSSFVLSYAFMYILAFYLTRNSFAAFISGLIFSLCPYHINKSWEHFGLAFIEFIPLYLFSLLKLRELPSLKSLFFCSLSLILVMLSDLTYAFIISLFSLFYFVFVLFYDFKKKANRKQATVFIKNFLLMVFLAMMVCLPAIVFSLKSNLDSYKQTSIVPIRPFHYLFSQSASLLAYLTPSKYHPIFGSITRTFEGGIFFGRGSIEQTIYLGWFALIVSFIALKRKRCFTSLSLNKSVDHKFVFALCAGIFVIGVIFSMPPFWNVLFFKVYFPSFFLYKVFPAFRAYARFSVLAIVAVSIFSAYGVSYFISNSKKKKALAFFFTLFALFDFATIPPFRTISVDQCPPVYKWLAEKKDSFSIIEYPLRLGDTSEGYVDLDYIFFQRFHEKAIVEGARPGTKAYILKESLVNLESPEVILLLKELQIRYVVVHLNEYANSRSNTKSGIIGELPDFSKVKGLNLVRKFENDEVYQVLNK